MRTVIRRHPVEAYFVITFGVSWAAALAVVSPWLMRGQSVPTLAGILMFPAMLLGPSLTGVVMTGIVHDRAGLRALGARLIRLRFSPGWYAVILIPPFLVLGVLLGLQRFVSKDFAPNLFVAGVLFGIPAGYLEELGWTGFAFEQMRTRRGPLVAAIAVGILWAVWHLPVVDFLGAAHPHGSSWLSFFLAFGAAMTAMRVLICWLYLNTGSIAATQLLHMSSTGALVVFSAQRIGASQEATWYGLYAITLWLVVALVVRTWSARLRRIEVAI